MPSSHTRCSDSLLTALSCASCHFQYPLRGYKRTNWEGGMRVTGELLCKYSAAVHVACAHSAGTHAPCPAAFVSGGLIPTNLRGTSNKIRFHIVDW